MWKALLIAILFSGYEVLTELQNIMGEGEPDPCKEGLLVDASNRFFTLIPTVHPTVISDLQTLKSKVLPSNLQNKIGVAAFCLGNLCNIPLMT